jgi:chemotaxis protein MotC
MSASRRWAAAGVVAGIVAFSLGGGYAEEGGKSEAGPLVLAPLPQLPHPVSEMVSDMQSLQARMAAGDKTAYAQQGPRLRAIGAAILAAPPDNWTNNEEVEAAAAYLLGGGQPNIIQRLLESGVVPKDQARLLRGSLAYVIGRSFEAEALLTNIDPRSVSLRLGGQLAFAEAVLLTTRSPDRAIALLDAARLLAPGSLVEEAALRREILMMGDHHDGDRVLFLTHQYMTRFSHSIYAENFIQGLAVSSVRYGLIDDLASLHKFEAMLTLVAPAQRYDFLLSVSRSQMISGVYEVSGAAADDVLGMLPAGSADESRARLYSSAAQAIGVDYQGGLANLKLIDRSKLNAADRGLLAAALHVATHLRDMPSEAALFEADREDRIAAARSPTHLPADSHNPVGVTIQSGETILTRSDALLSDKRSAP